MLSREFIRVNHDFINENTVKKNDDKNRMKEFLHRQYVGKKKIRNRKKDIHSMYYKWCRSLNNSV